MFIVLFDSWDTTGHTHTQFSEIMYRTFGYFNSVVLPEEKYMMKSFYNVWLKNYFIQFSILNNRMLNEIYDES